MRRLLNTISWVLTVVAVLVVAPAPVGAQERVDGAFSDTLIRDLGYPEAIVEVSPDGIVAPAELPAGPHLVTLAPAAGLFGFLVIVQPPSGLSDEEATRLALDAAAKDLAQADWLYLGGVNTAVPDEPVSFVVDLPPGEYQWAASSYGGGGASEIMHLAPLTVTAAGATPEAAAAAPLPEAGVVLEMTDDLQFILTPDPVPAGPRIWEIANTGTQSPHHVVFFRVPDWTTSEQFAGEFQGMFTGTPSAGGSVITQITWVAYAALQSGGRTTWLELDLEPATYAAACFIVDPETGRPHVVDGMVTVFAVTES